MGKLGEWIDEQDQEAKDRLVRAQRWTQETFIDKGHMCLVSHAKGRVELLSMCDCRESGYLSPGRAWCGEPHDLPQRDWSVAKKYDALCRRFGGDRVVRAIKLRAGASVEDLEPVSSAPTSSAGAHG